MYFSTRFAGLSQRFSGVFTGLLELALELIGATFDGVNDYLTLTGDLTGNADSKLGIFAARVRFNGGDGTKLYLTDTNGGRFRVYKDTTNRITLFGKNSAATTILNANAPAALTADGDYHTILMSWDMAGTVHSYIDDVSSLAIGTQVNDAIDYTDATAHKVGSDATANNKLNADITALYENYAENIDLSVEANRRKFFNADGTVADWGADGSTPTGSQPIIMFEGDYSQWHTNKGSGGGYTVVGALERPPA